MGVLNTEHNPSYRASDVLNTSSGGGVEGDDTAPKSAKAEKTVYTYFMQGERGGPIKIGRAVDVDKRRRELQTGHPYNLIVLARLDHDCELQLHARFARNRIVGEWFDPTRELLDVIAAIPNSLVPVDAPLPIAFLPRTAKAKVVANCEAWDRLVDGGTGEWMLVPEYEDSEVYEWADRLFLWHERTWHDATTVCDEGEDGEEECDGFCTRCLLVEFAEHISAANVWRIFVNSHGECLAIIDWREESKFQIDAKDHLRLASIAWDYLEGTMTVMLIGEGGIEVRGMSELRLGEWLGTPLPELSFGTYAKFLATGDGALIQPMVDDANGKRLTEDAG